ncbi:hypothetical protein CIG19_11755 [Enterobacterales bacterium CwR94]|nr:hypothetical protein CIG19_11755 [Enterobacterales bacterium CwR94]
MQDPCDGMSGEKEQRVDDDDNKEKSQRVKDPLAGESTNTQFGWVTARCQNAISEKCLPLFHLRTVSA